MQKRRSSRSKTICVPFDEKRADRIVEKEEESKIFIKVEGKNRNWNKE
jgi:hypothetical protein